ncbi:hypothetical protein [Parachitinimonas caeni]|uniref:Copper resistance protein CopC n=1 Tax=Parachitinimonas caeni TaxID=3031301 RepID=A0ABT7DT76_9NEIS|nr:hypothetical protein [Parachitinimonas caeni]MDK2123247.1 hypothetical protein [Parachitinimonas caeni]
MISVVRLWLIGLLVLPGSTASAHGGEDHGDTVTRQTVTPGIAPRAEAKSELFELLTELNGSQLTLYLDRFADNQPVQGARIEVESGTFKAVATAVDDHYRLMAGPLAKPGKHPLIFTITAGNDADLLETTLLVGGDDSAEPHPHPLRWRWPLLALGGVIAMAALLRFQFRRKTS